MTVTSITPIINNATPLHHVREYIAADKAGISSWLMLSVAFAALGLYYFHQTNSFLPLGSLGVVSLGLFGNAVYHVIADPKQYQNDQRIASERRGFAVMGMRVGAVAILIIGATVALLAKNFDWSGHIYSASLLSAASGFFADRVIAYLEGKRCHSQSKIGGLVLFFLSTLISAAGIYWSTMGHGLAPLIVSATISFFLLMAARVKLFKNELKKTARILIALLALTFILAYGTQLAHYFHASKPVLLLLAGGGILCALLSANICLRHTKKLFTKS